jgi:hypothetical protein
LDEREEIKTGENVRGDWWVKIFMNRGGLMSVPRQKSDKSIKPKKALSETTELNRMLTVGREATWVEGEQEDGRRPPPTVPQTRRSTPVV